MERFIDSCCDNCLHSRENPCGNFIECRLTGPLCHENKKCSEKRKALIAKYNHSKDYFQH